MSRLTFEPYIPLALWVLLALAAAGLLLAYVWTSRRRLSGWRRTASGALMTLNLVLPLTILLNPTWLERLPPPAGNPRLTILVDSTASMATKDGDQQQSRYEQACRLAVRVTSQLSEEFDVRTFTFDSSAKRVGVEQLSERRPDGDATDLSAALEDVLDDVPQGQAVLLLSDGIHNTGAAAQRIRESADKSKAMSVPVFVKTVGKQTGVQDLEVSLRVSQETTFVGQKTSVAVSLQQRGSLSDRVVLDIVLDGKVIQQETVDLVADGTTETIIQVGQEKSGLYRYDFRAHSLDQEVTAVNNRAPLLLRVVEEPVKVLLLEGKPYWDTKFLVRTLAADPSLELASVVRMSEARFFERIVARPVADEPEEGGASDASEDEDEDEGEQEKDDDSKSDDDTSDDNTSDDSTSDDSTSDESSADESSADDAAAESTDTAQRAGDSPAEETSSDRWKVYHDVDRILADPKNLSKYQIVVLGRGAEIYLTDESVSQLRKWLLRGDGSLLCYRGSPSSQIGQRLGQLMPVRWKPSRESRFRMKMTDSGQSLRWLATSGNEADLLTRLPSLATVTEVDRSNKPLAVVLATRSGAGDAQAEPMISYQPFGSGRVVVVEGAGMWRWAFLPPQYQSHDRVYGTLWRSLFRWLVSHGGLLPSQRVALQSDKVTFAVNEAVGGMLLLGESEIDKPAPLVVLTGGTLAAPQEIQPQPLGALPGQFRVEFGKLPEGTYQAQLKGFKDDAAARTVFDVRGNLAERLEVAARPDRMQEIANRSGGLVLQSDDPQQLAGKFREYLVTNLPQRTRRTTAWDRWWVLAGVMGLWAATWAFRRRSGLI